MLLSSVKKNNVLTLTVSKFSLCKWIVVCKNYSSNKNHIYNILEKVVHKKSNVAFKIKHYKLF